MDTSQNCPERSNDSSHSQRRKLRVLWLLSLILLSLLLLYYALPHCTRTRAAFVFIIGFWMLDLANNTVQGPARALLADLAGHDQRNSANAMFCSWMSIGNILGFLSGSSGNWHKWFPFFKSRACCEACGNLKATFLVAATGSESSDSKPLTNSGKSSEVEEEDQVETFNDNPWAVLVNLLTSLCHLPVGMHSMLIVMALTWLSWFPFFLFDTDWMGREVYHGDPKGDAAKVEAYDEGVREGAIGLLLNSLKQWVSFFIWRLGMEVVPLLMKAIGWQGGSILALETLKRVVVAGNRAWDALVAQGLRLVIMFVYLKSNRRHRSKSTSI
ncbi:unnamed protein product [Lactuca virosa]|uniref:Sucrose transporter n=1 Tax=Lactuca virosa TaxID=75947 RepID=A0AAU9PJI0_9ASTR|nr:unnamed protein product [Lactuca virosa]